MRSALATIIMVLAVATLSACERGEQALVAPEIHYGQDMCAVCSMIISEERFAGAIALRREGRVVYLLFDDVGEMLEHTPTNYTEIKWYAHDTTTSEWLDAEQAFFMRSPELVTPMARGIGTYATREAAEKAKAEYGGELLDFETIRAEFSD